MGRRLSVNFPFLPTQAILATFRPMAPRSSSAASFPVWRSDGKEILFLGHQGVTSIAVEKAGAGLRFSPARLLFSGESLRFAPGVVARSSPLAASHDGSRIFWLRGRDIPESNILYVRTGALKSFWK